MHDRNALAEGEAALAAQSRDRPSRDRHESGGDDLIELTLPATPTHLSAARNLAAELATRQDFNLDEVDDLRLAIDEACATLVGRAVVSSRLTCVFRLAPGEVAFEGRVNSRSDESPAQGTFGWQVMTTLVDEVQVLRDRTGGHDDGDVYQVGLGLRKRRLELAG